MIKSSILIATAVSSILFAGMAMAQTATSTTNGNGGAPATTDMTQPAQQNGTMMTNPAPAGDANMSTGNGAVGAMKDSNAAMKGTTQ